MSQERGEKTNARVPECAHKEKQTIPEAIVITHNHVSAAHTHTQPCVHSCTNTHRHTYTACQEGPLGSSHGRSQQRTDKAGWICLKLLLLLAACCCWRVGVGLTVGTGDGRQGIQVNRRDKQKH